MQHYAIITGASRGIGLATATLFQKHHYSIINISRHPCPLNNVINLKADLTHPTILKTLCKQLKKIITTKTKICLVHNAMLLDHDTVSTIKPETLRHFFEIGIVAPTQLNQFCLPWMDQGSSILYIGSTLSEKAVPNAASYVIQKHAVVGLMRATCQDLDGRIIHTACICPGITDTEMLQKHLTPEKRTALIAMTAAKRLVEPEEIARVIYFCAENSAINGSVIHAHLGQLGL